MDPLTLNIKMCATSHETLEHDSIHVLRLSKRACVVKVETSHTRSNLEEF